AVTLLQNQAGEIDKRIGKNDDVNTARKEIVALIAYLQRLGTDIRKTTNSEN
ncbi:MAG: hypothetical protein HQ517_07300, partial [SAR324 cluster bacterium]|nr:hypothetical protein [SAR324 cluster bacterium]